MQANPDVISTDDMTEDPDDPDSGVPEPAVSPATRLALLLTLRLDHHHHNLRSDPAAGPVAPLDAGELTRLARWLQDHGRDALALPDAPERLLNGWEDRSVPVERLLPLLANQRQEEIDRAIARWTALGVWIMGRKDPGYPRQRLTARLGDGIPPVFFGVGNRELVAGGGTAIVGSRDTHVATLTLAQQLGTAEGRAGRTVISGGARGVDERAVHGAFLGGGSAVVILGDGLIRQAAKVVHAAHLAAGTLTLISPYAPDAPFSTGNAMGRNRLIYCLADEAVVVASTEGRGGSFAGASEALRRGWGPIWVAPWDDPRSGNPALIRAGARALADRSIDHSADRESVAQPKAPATEDPAEALYRHFLTCWRGLPENQLTIGTLATALGLTSEQTRSWVLRAVERRDAVRLGSPVRYAIDDQ